MTKIIAAKKCVNEKEILLALSKIQDIKNDLVSIIVKNEESITTLGGWENFISTFQKQYHTKFNIFMLGIGCAATILGIMIFLKNW